MSAVARRRRAVPLPQRRGADPPRDGAVLLPAEAPVGRGGARSGTTSSRRAEERLGIPAGSIRTTVLIETIHAAFQMDEILHALGPYAAGLNAGRWDYLFSCIKTFRGRPDRILPDRAQLTMTTPFMRAYTELLVRTCHRRGAHAIGGMAAFIPSRRDPVVNEAAMARVREDKERESRDGFDGTWVAHPGPRPARDRDLRRRPRRRGRTRRTAAATRSRSRAAELLDFAVPGGRVTEAGVRLERVRRAPVPRRLAGAATARPRSTT